MIIALAVMIATFVVSLTLTAVVRRYAVWRELLDEPNERSLHDTPTPRGGGIAILLSMSAALILLHAAGWLTWPVTVAWAGIGIGFGGLGWLDDHTDLAIAPRLLAQFVLAAVFVAVCLRFVGGSEISTIGVSPVIIAIAAAVAIVWFVNLFNFMDGADGFAGGAAVAAALAGGVVSAVAGGGETALTALAVAGAAAGFLVWNWQPARIFMGDAGSYFLGFQFCALAALDITAGRGGWPWAILLAPFITDASLTLARRVWRRERFWQAHRSHVYQLIVISGWSHARVSAALVSLTLLVLAPAALFAAVRPGYAAAVTAAVYGLNGMLWLFARQRYATQ